MRWRQHDRVTSFFLWIAAVISFQPLHAQVQDAATWRPPGALTFHNGGPLAQPAAELVSVNGHLDVVLAVDAYRQVSTQTKVHTSSSLYYEMSMLNFHHLHPIKLLLIIIYRTLLSATPPGHITIMG